MENIDIRIALEALRSTQSLMHGGIGNGGWG